MTATLPSGRGLRPTGARPPAPQACLLLLPPSCRPSARRQPQRSLCSDSCQQGGPGHGSSCSHFSTGPQDTAAVWQRPAGDSAPHAAAESASEAAGSGEGTPNLRDLRGKTGSQPPRPVALMWVLRRRGSLTRSWLVFSIGRVGSLRRSHIPRGVGLLLSLRKQVLWTEKSSLLAWSGPDRGGLHAGHATRHRSLLPEASVLLDSEEFPKINPRSFRVSPQAFVYENP